MMMRNLVVVIGALVVIALAAEKKVITPVGGRPPVGPYSPGIQAGDYVYASGQGAARPDGSFPDSPEEQTLQCLENVRRIIEASGVTMEHVVYAQVYLKDMGAYEAMDRAWRKTFETNPPARAVLGVARMPTDTPVEITAVAIRDLKQKRAVNTGTQQANASAPAAVLTADRLYISGMDGRDPRSGSVPTDSGQQAQAALDSMAATLKAAGLDFRHVVFVNPYLTDKMDMGVMNKVYAKHFEFGNTPARATMRVNSLPDGTAIQFTAVAVRDLSKRRAVRPKNMAPSPTASPCVFAGDTLYCSAKSGFIPGPNSGIYASTVETQVRQTMRNLLDGLEEAGMTFADVVATNVYLDDINEFVAMNKTYAEYFSSTPPTRTTVQPMPPLERKADARGRWPTLEQISLIAVK
jgi:reactive intermediate/imine deaminase